MEVTRLRGEEPRPSVGVHAAAPPPRSYPDSSGPSPEGGAMRRRVRTVSPHPCPRASRCPLWPQLLLIACPISPAQLHLEMSSVYRQLLCGPGGPGGAWEGVSAETWPPGAFLCLQHLATTEATWSSRGSWPRSHTLSSGSSGQSPGGKLSPAQESFKDTRVGTASLQPSTPCLQIT